jgi:hypothetical protein
MSSDIQAADWSVLVENKKADVTIFYDSETMAASNNTVRVWLKWVYKNHEFKDHENQLFELSCQESKFRVLEEITYLKEGWSSEKDEKNERIRKRTSPSDWQFVEPDTVGMIMKKKFCKE